MSVCALAPFLIRVIGLVLCVRMYWARYPSKDPAPRFPLPVFDLTTH